MSRARRWIGLATVLVFYLLLLTIAEIRSGAADATSQTLSVDGVDASCTVESVYIGDGAIQGSRVCRDSKRGH